ncbi:SDR family oxidoreductase [Verrucomicrobiaceae bacterium 5K15]|uniref:SDR family oxidoreductase n=1 Tax=Oceaniferula flava TaxID=2800421 RepID=A0AAE2SAD4_9BACT|nr:SDR family oxidoreductase [Oceaniferula flavus]MBK1854748.1 SDR family oxidoreductase [Oceaniferula flavus]MBM1136054.1 SDR family oxidoreductase [Oceaniferula flavus]
MPTEPEKVAIVTGGSRGIGAAIARRLAADGCAVIVNYSHSQEQADEVVQAIRDAGGRAQAAKADVSNAEEVAELFDIAEQAFGGVDILVNNAGVLSMVTLAEAKDEDFDRLVAVNLKGSFNTMREAAKRLRDQGRIINLTSSVIGLALPKYAIYVATKAAVEAMGQVLANEMRGRQICVNALAPGPTATDLFFKGKPEALVEKLTHMSPLERLGTPEDIANAVSFLASPDGAWINGQVIRANGGIV